MNGGTTWTSASGLRVRCENLDVGEAAMFMAYSEPMVSNACGVAFVLTAPRGRNTVRVAR